MSTFEVRPKPPLSGTQINLLIFGLSVIFCVGALLTGNGIYLVVPFMGLASIIVSIVKRSWWTIPLGIVEIASPFIVIYMAYCINSFS